jgi:hypothetical protein
MNSNMVNMVNKNANNSAINNGNMSRKNRRNNAGVSRKNRRNNAGGMNAGVTRKQNGGRRSSVIGSRVQVMHGTAHHTSGGLVKSDLMMHKGRIVSRKAHAAGKKAIRRLRAAGYIAKKGHFTLFKKRHGRRH